MVDHSNQVAWRIERATPADVEVLADMFLALWPDHPRNEMLTCAADRVAESAAAPTFIARDVAGGDAIGFIYLDLRSHAEGCESSPVPYIEGWWVAEAWRGRGLGRALVEHAEHWARDGGHTEIASDAELHNTGSQAAHRALGFSPEPATIPFHKKLTTPRLPPSNS